MKNNNVEKCHGNQRRLCQEREIELEIHLPEFQGKNARVAHESGFI